MPTIEPDYPRARARFLAACEHVGAIPETIDHPLLGASGESLATDVISLGDPAASRVLFIVSGTHGVEGYAGSMLQSAWLECDPTIPDSTRVILVHAINPHGFSFDRRVTEDNVDLNRNFVDWAEPPGNSGYDAIASVVVPAEWTPDAQEASTNALLEIVVANGLEALQDTIARGQYDHPHGVFYGGTGPTWSHQVLEDIVCQHSHAAQSVVVVDLHTGLGDWGNGELISAAAPDEPSFARATSLWGDVTSMTNGSAVSTPVTGEWFSEIKSWLPNTEITAVALEYGTVDAVTVLQALRADAWRSGASTVEPLLDEEIRRQLRTAFLDDDPAWAAALWRRFVQVIDLALGGSSVGPSLDLTVPRSAATV